VATKLTEKKVGGKWLGFIALVFSAIFFTSSVEVYWGDRAEEKAGESAASTLKQLSRLSKFAVLSKAWHLESSKSVNVFSPAPINENDWDTRRPDANLAWVYYLRYSDLRDKDTSDRFDKANSNYEKALADFAHTVRVEKENSSIIVSAPDGSYVYTKAGGNSIDVYSYELLFLESQRLTKHLSSLEYQNRSDQLLREYAKRLLLSDTPYDERHLISESKTVVQQIAELRELCDSLKKQPAQAERTPLERWLPVVTAILTVLVALSAHFIAWRTDRRNSREAELMPLRRQELEQTIIQKNQQIKEKGGRIIIPTSQEIQLYSRAVPVGDFSWEKRSEPYAGGDDAQVES
jgi:hypothetical protein